MNKKLFLPLFIAACHIPIFLLRFPEQKRAKKLERKIAVNTIHLMEEAPITAANNLPIAKPSTKKRNIQKAPVKKKKKQKPKPKRKPKPKKRKVITKKKAPKKKSKPTRKKKTIQKALGKSLTTKKPRNKKIASSTKKTGSSNKKNGKKDAGKEQREYNQYLQTVVLALKDSLTLPEAGKVKLAITVSEQGKIIKIVSLLVESENNLNYLKENLAKMALPAYAKKENRTFTIVFCDEK